MESAQDTGEMEAMDYGAEGSQAEGADDGEEGMGESAAEDDIFKNNHDLIGVQGILRAQKNEIDRKKVSYSPLR